LAHVVGTRGMTRFAKKEAGKCTCCGCGITKQPDFQGDTPFHPESVQVWFPYGKMENGVQNHVCVDLCGECAPTLKRQDYKQIEECLVRSLHDGIDASRLAEVENLRAVLSTAEKDLSTEEIERFISEGRVRLARWTPEKVKAQKNHYSKAIKIRFELKRERHIDKGAVMGSYI
jgi:hypothetical protein